MSELNRDNAKSIDDDETDDIEEILYGSDQLINFLQ